MPPGPTAVVLRLFQGHLSLAQANFTNPNRIRYGQDFYDDRTQASTRLYALLYTAMVETRAKVGGKVKSTVPRSNLRFPTTS